MQMWVISNHLLIIFRATRVISIVIITISKHMLAIVVLMLFNEELTLAFSAEISDHIYLVKHQTNCIVDFSLAHIITANQSSSSFLARND